MLPSKNFFYSTNQSYQILDTWPDVLIYIYINLMNTWGLSYVK